MAENYVIWLENLRMSDVERNLPKKACVCRAALLPPPKPTAPF